MTKLRAARARWARHGLLVAIIGGLMMSAGAPLSALGLERERMPQAVFGARVELVTLPVSVLGSGDLPADDLTAEDFRVIEDGVEQEVALVLSPQDARLDVALLMDVSDSMWPLADAARSSAASFLDQLSDDDCVFLLRFTALPGPGLWGAPDDPDIRAAISQTPMEGGSAVIDATAEGFERLQTDSVRCGPGPDLGMENGRLPPRRRALVVVTDGVDQHSVVLYPELLGIALRSDAAFFPVELGNVALLPPETGEAEPNEGLPRADETTAEARWELFNALDYARAQSARRLRELREISRATGGQSITGGRSKEKLTASYAEIVSLLRSYYLVGYYPGALDSAGRESELPSWHEVEVKVRRRGYRVQTRSGYYRTPTDVFAARRHVRAGIDLNTRGKASEALVEFGLALQADPYSWGAYYHRGGSLILAGELGSASQALLSAAGLNPGRAEVHKLAFRVSLELGDLQTAWDQAIRAHQAGADLSEELMLLGQEFPEPVDLEERLNAPRLYVESLGAVDPIDEAALRILNLTLAQGLSEVPEIGLIDQQELADYRLLVRMGKLSEKSPRKLEVDLELWESESAGGERVTRRGVTLSDIEDRERVVAELALHIAELSKRLSEHLR